MVLRQAPLESLVTRQGHRISTSASAGNSKGQTHAFIWEDGEISELNNLIPKATGAVLTRATAIHTRGQLVVEQQIRADMPIGSFLLTPKKAGSDCGR